MKCKNCNYDFDEYNDIFCPGCGIRIRPADKIKPKKPLYGKKVCIWGFLLSWIFPIGWICGLIGYIQSSKNDLKEYRWLAVSAFIIATVVFLALFVMVFFFHDKIPFIESILKGLKIVKK